ncbi:acyltransferase family protein [Saccharicrinis sp. FJH2]|uniref:acyltransferase family protein n=1 Tax=Saccharicrinis sp. FJH65 TaxID=3344659 RepID=UPI0035F2E486
MISIKERYKKLEWITVAKAIAILGIILNHFVEALGSYNWFTNPSDNWPDLATRLGNILPQGQFLIERIFYLLGWLGDNFVGVFILLSGLLLTLSSLSKPQFLVSDFYRKRLLRIFPVYISIHLIVIFGSLFFKNKAIDVGSPDVLLSLLGLRFSESLFYFINPSWWFITLILQLYVIFPALFILLRRTKPLIFLMITIGFTMLSRLVGILGYYPFGNMYMWMNGSFFGTRLAEFAIGMFIGQYIASGKALPQATSILSMSILSYVLGFIGSIFVATTLFSNFLIAFGLTGLCYSFYVFISKRFRTLNKMLIWIGTYSFSIYLTHQMAFVWAYTFNTPESMIIATVLVFVLIIATGIFVESHITSLRLPRINIKSRFTLFMFIIYYCFLILLFYFLEPRIQTSYQTDIFNAFLGINGILLISVINQNKGNYKLANNITIASFVTIFYSLFFVAPGNGKAISLFLILILLILLVPGKTRNIWTNSIVSTLIAIFIIVGAESWIKKNYPLEAGSWGELPALEVNPTRTYSLIPNKETHLKYNNYDYILKTNSMGLAFPEELLNRTKDSTYQNIIVLGDAFTMPEAFEYENSYVGLLQNKLDSTGLNYNIINAGVTGYCPNEELAQLKELIPIIKPSKVILQFFANEFIEINFTPKERLSEIGLISESENREIKKLNFPQLRANINNSISKIKKIVDPSFIPPYNFRKSFMFLYEDTDYSYYADSTLYKIALVLKKMDNLCKNINAEFLVLYTPSQIEISKPQDITFFPFNNSNELNNFNLNKPFQKLEEICQQNNIHLYNLKPVLKEYPNQLLYFKNSWHWNENGHIIISRDLYKLLFPSQTPP